MTYTDLTKPIIPGHKSLITSMQSDWNMPPELAREMEVYSLVHMTKEQISQSDYPNFMIGNNILYVCLFHKMYPNHLRDYKMFNLSFRKHKAFKNGYVMITPDPSTAVHPRENGHGAD